jgi:enoyl-CoA hydratase/carnithine racemase
MPVSVRTSLHFQNFDVTFPDERIVQVTLTRTEKLNCIDKETSREITKIWERLDEDENLWVGIITGVGRAFCTGADLTGRHRHLAVSIKT